LDKVIADDLVTARLLLRNFTGHTDTIRAKPAKLHEVDVNVHGSISE
jgi:hypothetical protein